MPSIPNLGFIHYPGMKAIAYLNVFKKLEYFPSRIVSLEGKIRNWDSAISESDKYGYKDDYFDPRYDLACFIHEFGVTNMRTDAISINDERLLRKIKETPETTWIFTGGGIAGPKVLSLGKKFIHVHPGKLPAFRGSTCFYYSILKEFQVAATAFYLTRDIDAGEVLTTSEFKINLQISAKQPCFMDFFLDPWIRSYTLRKVISRYSRGVSIADDTFNEKEKNQERKPNYYVIHPFLRHLAISHLNKKYEPDNHRGIIPIESE